MLNAVAPTSGPLTVRVLPSGRVTLIERFAATLSTKFLLRQFPFDNQNFQILIAPFSSGAVRVDLRADKRMTQLISGPFLEFQQWKLDDIT